MSIENVVTKFYTSMTHDQNHRYLSWEHCFNYFNRERCNQDIDTACLHLSFYLASWGMYRGSSALLWKDYKVHKEVVELILDDKNKILQHIEFNAIDAEHIIILKDTIRSIYNKKITCVDGREKDYYASDTLITKILLGTLGCVPAYDRFFLKGLDLCEIKPKTFNQKSVKELFDFYNKPENKDQIDKISEKTNYPIMKILDMYFFKLGLDYYINKEKIKQEEKERKKLYE